MNQTNYISNFGTAVRYTLIGALTHELGHALGGKADPDVENQGDRLTDYQATNIPFVNDIWSELTLAEVPVPGLDLMISYTGTATSNYQKLGFAYTKNLPIIDTAINVDYLRRNESTDGSSGWSTVRIGASKDLLIGGSRTNTLESGAGNDFLFGGGGNDTLRGGAGIDTAIYFGNESDYEIVMHRNWLGIWDGSWDASHVRGEQWDGKDRLENIEYVRFGNGRRYRLTANGLTFQSDIALVIDTTKSVDLNANVQMLNYLKQQAAAIVSAMFANNQDARIGIIAHKDTTNGEPSQVILPFTDQEEIADRQSAAIAAINSLTASGGGDIPETGFDGLRLALNGALGQWRPAAGTLKVILLTDSPIKDYQIANEVSQLAQNIGATVGSSSTEILSGGNIDTYSLELGNSYGGVTNQPHTPHVCDNGGLDCYLTGEATNIPFVPSNEPIEIVPMTAQVQIFTIFTGPTGTNTKALEAIANANGGTFQTAATNDDLFQKLLAIVSAPTVEPILPTVAVIASDAEAAEVKPGEIADPGQFVLTRTGDLSQPLTVNYTRSGTATSGSDYQSPTGAVTFAVGENSAIVDLNILDDNIAEGIETISLNVAESSNYTIESNNSNPIAIFDNDFSPARLIQPTPNSLSLEGGEEGAVLKFTKLASAGNRNEIAVFVVDDERGEIDGILPGDDKYLAAAISRSQVIFSTLGNSDLDRQFDSNSERYLNFYAGDRLQFLTIADDTLDSVRANLSAGKAIPNVVFSLPAANVNTFDSAQFTALANNGGYQITRSDRLNDGEISLDNFDGWSFRVETTDRPLTAGNSLQGSPLGEVIDLRDFADRTLTIDLNTVSNARYDNYIGFYAVEDELGTLANGLKPGDAGYAEAAIRSAILQSFKSESKSDLSLAGGKILAPVVIANGDFADFLNSNPQNRENSNIHAYFNYLGANADRVDHFRLLGDNKFGVEDLYGGGDSPEGTLRERDYNDLIVTIAVKN